jgi:hypothetical protein
MSYIYILYLCMLHVHVSIYFSVLQKNKLCRGKDMGFIYTPTMLFYMDFPEPNDMYNK